MSCSQDSMASDTQTTGLNGPDTSSRHGEQSHIVSHQLTVDGCRCEGVCAQFPQYTVVFGGVGQPPPEATQVGYCSQIATFTRTGETAWQRVPHISLGLC